MEMNKYQKILSREVETSESLVHQTLNLSSSVGMVAELTNDYTNEDIEVDRELMVDALSIALYSVSNIAHKVDVTLDEVAAHGVNSVLMNKPDNISVVDVDYKVGQLFENIREDK